MKNILGIVCWLVAMTAGATSWRNLDDAHRVAGRKASEGYLGDKVVMVCRFDGSDGSRRLLKRAEEVWQSFKTKRFVMLGSGSKSAIGGLGVTFPVYDGAAISVGEPRFSTLPFIYVVDETGLIIYRGHDDRLATEAMVIALTDNDAPRSVVQWRRFLDYELEHLPGHAYLRLRDFRRAHPEEAVKYDEKIDELKSLPQVKELADLIEFAKRAKDPPIFSKKEAAKRRKYESLVKEVLTKCAPLVNLADPRMAQEAKNALADLKWASSSF